MQPSALAKRLFILLFVLAIPFYFYGIGALPLIGPDEPRYAQIAREMLLRGDFVTPTLAGYTWFEKPALLYWMMIAAYKFFGVSEFSARFGPALSGLLTCFAIWFATRKLERAYPEELNGLNVWSTTFTAASLGLIVFSRGATFDVVVSMTITFALVLFLLQETVATERKRVPLLLGFYAAMGFSLLAKGLVGIVLPLGVVATYFLLVRKRPSRRLVFSLLWGLPVTVIVSAIWYGPVIYKHGWVFIDEFFIQHHFARYVSNKYLHSQRIYFYIPILLMLTLPWTALLIESLVNLRGVSRSQEINRKFRLFAVSWLLFPIVFFSLAGSKLPGYLIPVIPATALLIGERINRLNSRWPIISTGVIATTMAVSAYSYSIATGMPPLGLTVVVMLPLLLSGLLAIFFARKKTFALLSITFALLLSLTLILRFVAIDFAEKQSVRSLLTFANEHGYGDLPIFIRRGSDRTAEFYASGRVVYGDDGEPHRLEEYQDITAETQRRGERILVLMPVEHLDQYRNSKHFEILVDNGNLALLVTRVK